MTLEQLRAMSPGELVIAAVDIAIVSYVLFRLFMLIRGTRAVQLIRGIIVLLLATTVSQWLHLYTINWLLQKASLSLAVAVPIVFQPELRRALEQLGRGRFFARPDTEVGEEETLRVIGEIVKAVGILARDKVGALIVLERETGLGDIVETGIRMEAVVTSELLTNVFIPNTPLHDGAVIIRGNRIVAAACFLPLTEATGLSTELGSRHRAGLGVTEHSDAVTIIVSEETGIVSLANAGKLIRSVDERTLREMLQALLKRPGGLARQLFNFD